MPQSMKLWSERFILWITIFAGCCIFFYWFFHNPVKAFVEAVPGHDNRPARVISASDSVIIGEHYTLYVDAYETSLAGKWPNFRGADHDNISKENIRLIDKWPADGPKILWEKEMGEGHAAAAIYNGRVYLLDYD